ncbi:MAG: hypothetical protein U9Q67_01270 [Patescibacteria group bacterium]|nr:hypothetical protein [Patescibacteria group bacterium]
MANKFIAPERLGQLSIGIVERKKGKLRDFYLKLLCVDPSVDDTSGYYEIETTSPGRIDIEPAEFLIDDLPQYKDITHLVRIEVNGIEKVFKKIQSLGGKPIRKPILQPYGKKECYVLDPEENLVQLYENI